MQSNTESKWSQIDKRLNLQSIGEFIRHGGDVTQIDRQAFTERLAKADNDLRSYINKTCEHEKTEDIVEQIAVYSNILKDIYFALGMKTGAQIIIQLTSNFEADF